MTRADDGTAPAAPDRGAVSPLRQWRDRGVATMDAPSPIGTLDAYAYDTCGPSPGRACPRCSGPVYRIPRRFVDLLLSAVVPVHRYRCDEMGCNWEGNLRATRESVPSLGGEDPQSR